MGNLLFGMNGALPLESPQPKEGVLGTGDNSCLQNPEIEIPEFEDDQDAKEVDP